MSEIKKDQYELSNEELEHVVGGQFTPEADDWVNRNIDTIMNRIPVTCGGWDGWSQALSVLNAAFKDDTIYDVEGLKAYLKARGANCDDLT